MPLTGRANAHFFFSEWYKNQYGEKMHIQSKPHLMAEDGSVKLDKWHWQCH